VQQQIVGSPTTPKTYLVTGAAGFIGAAVADRLVAAGHRVVTIDNLTTGRREWVPQGVQLIEGDCADATVIAQLAAFRFDAILHIAGQSSGEISFDQPEVDLRSNVLSTLLLLRYGQETGCRRFIYASTMSVYGEQPDEPVTESAPPHPISFYAVGKLASERYMEIYSRFGMSNIALRLFSVYGPGQNMENHRQGMVSIFVDQVLKHRKVLVKGSAERYRDFVYIDDVVSAFLGALETAQDGYRCYNVASGVRTTVSDLLQEISAVLTVPFPVSFTGGTVGDLHGLYGSGDRLRAAYGDIMRTDLRTGLTKMIAWAAR
jgi:UDP-glucose 4-epimerase